MRLSLRFVCLSLALVQVCVRRIGAFTPVGFSGASRRSITTRSLSPIDSSNLQELPNQIQSLHDALSTLPIADLDAGTLTDMTNVAQSVDSSGAVEEVAKSNNGWFGFLTVPTMGFLELIHRGLVSAGLDSNSWGISIIILTLTIKLLTFPLTKSQLESTNKMQALQPQLKEVQAKYQSNPEVMNQKIAELYQTNNVNPLAGCIPSLVQIPVFVGLYRAVLDLANENKLDEPFFWLPSLEGPLYGADPTKGSAWLFDNWANGAPSLGWEDTIAFLVLPVFLVISQFLSMEIMTPKDQKQQQPVFLKFLPLLIGWFSLNVPSALCIYWVTNNLVTTLTSVTIRNNLKMEPASLGTTTAAAPPPSSSVFTPPTIREKPEGFGSSSPVRDGVTPITSSAIDAEVVVEGEEAVSIGSTEKPRQKRRGKKKKKRRNS